MNAARKKWKVVCHPSFTEWPMPSMKKAYEEVMARREAWKAGGSRVSSVAVFVNEGRGWELYERIRFADE